MIRKAFISEIKHIYKLIQKNAKEGKLLPRAYNELYENIRDFFVFEKDKNVSGTCALHISWEDLAEIKSFAVDENERGKGIGKKLLKSCIDEAKKLGVKRVFVLTYIPEFFEKNGFRRIEKSDLPQKIWGECINCVHFPDCEEIALIKEL